jgi:methyltransferase-like protein
VTEVNDDWGTFDYIIAHGFYSWVPHEVRQHLLKVFRQQLSPQGVAFISYNALPGCYLRTMLREMLLFHVRGFEQPEERVNQARALVRFLALAQDSEDEYRLWLKAELERVEDHAPGHLYHDELAAINDPFYFVQFMETAAQHGLQYLAEADYFEMSDHVFRDEVRERLKQLAGNRWLREQYLDFLKCRRFRQTLLCQGEATLKDKPDHRVLENFLVGSSAVCARGEVELKPGVNCVFETPKGGKCQTDLPMGKAALNILGALWPMPLAFAELASEIRRRLQSDGLSTEAAALSHEALSEFLLQLYAGGVVEFRTWLPSIAREPGARPIVYPVARWQAARGDSVASLFHLAVKVEDELGRQLLTWLDGTVDHNQLAERVWEFLKSKKALEIGAGGEKEARCAVAAKLEDNLSKLAKLGLLMDPKT